MKKLLLLLSFCFLFVISGRAELKTYTEDCTVNPFVDFPTSAPLADFTGYTGESKTNTGLIYTLYGSYRCNFNTSGFVILGKRDAYIVFPTFSNGVITEIRITLSANSSAANSSLLEVNSDNNETELVSLTMTKGGINKYTIASKNQGKDKKYKFKITSAHNVQITKIEIDVEETTAPATQVATPTITPAFGDIVIGEKITISCETAEATLNGFLTVGETKTELKDVAMPYTYTVKEEDFGKTISVSAQASLLGYEPSSVLEGSYTVVAPTPAAPIYMLYDVLTINDAGNPGSYTNFEITTKNGAAYAGRAMSNYNSFQINGSTSSTSSARGSGIFMTKSVGNVSKVIIKWNDNTSATKRTLAIYGKNEPYEAYVSEENDELLKYRLKDGKSPGTLLTSFTYDGSTTPVEYIVEGQYRYLMILPTTSNAMYLESIEFVWDDAYSGGKESTYTLLDAGKSLSNGNYAVLVSGNIAVSRADATQGAEVTLGENNLVLEKAQTDVDEFEVISSGNTINGKSCFYLYGGVENEVVKNRHYLGTPSFVTDETEAAEFYVDDEALLRYKDGNYLAYVGGAFVKSADRAGAVTLYVNDSGITTDVEVVEIEDADAPVEYYNLQGVRVANPQNGLYIVRQGNKVSKQIIR